MTQKMTGKSSSAHVSVKEKNNLKSRLAGGDRRQTGKEGRRKSLADIRRLTVSTGCCTGGCLILQDVCVSLCLSYLVVPFGCRFRSVTPPVHM